MVDQTSAQFEIESEGRMLSANYFSASYKNSTNPKNSEKQIESMCSNI